MRLALGTVQLGLSYGISNEKGKTCAEEASRILHSAKANGIDLLDTASEYGDAEESIGRNKPDSLGMRIVTKSPPVRTPGIADHCLLVTQNLTSSLEKLKSEQCYALLTHGANDLLGADGTALYNHLIQLKEKGLVKKIGASVYTDDQIDQLLSKYKLDIIQAPFSIADQRLIRSGHLKKMKDHNIEIHARSLFLQGLLLMEPERVSSYFSPITPQLKEIAARALSEGMTVLEMALGFANGVKEIDYGICGVNTVEQLEQIVTASRTSLSPNDYMDLEIKDSMYLNPSNWKVQ